VTLAMHAFWNVPDPMTRMMQQAMFMKNLGLLGGALLITYFGAGPVSLDERVRRPLREAIPERAAA
jgi:putative oxidoreductase